MHCIALSQAYNAIPRIMDFVPGPHKSFFTDSSKLFQFIRDSVESHKLNLDPQNPGDFIDCFLLRLNKVHEKVVGGREAKGNGLLRVSTKLVSFQPGDSRPRTPPPQKLRADYFDWKLAMLSRKLYTYAAYNVMSATILCL